MIVADIILQAIIHKEMSIDSVNARTHLNEATGILAALYDTAKVRSTATIVCTDVDTEYALPTGAMAVLKVVNSNGEYNKLFYTVSVGYIQFQDVGAYTVTCLGSAAPVTLDSETPTIYDSYHRLLAKYIAYKELKTIKLDVAADYKSDFFQEAAAINQALTKGKKRGRYTPVSQFR